MYQLLIQNSRGFDVGANANVSRAIRKPFSNIREPEESPYIQKR